MAGDKGGGWDDRWFKTGAASELTGYPRRSISHWAAAGKIESRFVMDSYWLVKVVRKLQGSDLVYDLAMKKNANSQK